MRLILSLSFLILFLPFVVSAAEGVDLQIDGADIGFSVEEFVVGEEIEVTAEIVNSGDEVATGVVSFYLGDELVGEVNGFQVEADDSADATVSLTVPEDSFEIRVEISDVDPEDLDSDNNVGTSATVEPVALDEDVVEEEEEGDEVVEEVDQAPALIVADNQDKVGSSFSPKAVFSYERKSWNSFEFKSVMPPVPGTRYEWDFGDGATSSRQNVDHTFSNSGEYEVSLAVTNIEGEKSKDTTTVAIPFYDLNNKYIMGSIGGLGFLLLLGFVMVLKPAKRTVFQEGGVATEQEDDEDEEVEEDEEEVEEEVEDSVVSEIEDQLELPEPDEEVEAGAYKVDIWEEDDK